MNKSVAYLLIVYGFPPNPGIGGRRWAKYARVLAEQGNEIHVIAVQPYQRKISHWTEDTKHPNIHVHFLKAHYPEVILRGPRSIWEKVKYRRAIARLSRELKGSIYDKAAYWKEPLTQLAFELMDRHSIQYVIASAAPFNIPVIASSWKRQRPGLVVVSDLRDPWLENKHYGMQGLSEAQRKYEAANEASVVEYSDLFTVPVEEMAMHYRQKFPELAKKISVLPHAYDTRDYHGLKSGKKSTASSLRFVYGGTLGLVGMEIVMRKLMVELQQFVHASGFGFEFYTHTPILASEIEQAGLQNVIQYRQPVPVNQYLQVLSEADCCLLFLSEYNKNWMITKFCEFLPLRKPILVFAAKGAVSDFVVQNRLGYHFDPASNSWLQQLGVVKKEAEEGWPSFNREFDHSSFSAQSVAGQLAEKIQWIADQRK